MTKLTVAMLAQGLRSNRPGEQSVESALAKLCGKYKPRELQPFEARLRALFIEALRNPSPRRKP